MHEKSCQTFCLSARSTDGIIAPCQGWVHMCHNCKKGKHVFPFSLGYFHHNMSLYKTHVVNKGLNHDNKNLLADDICWITKEFNGEFNSGVRPEGQKINFLKIG